MPHGATRRGRQKAEILASIDQGRVAHALDLAYEHFAEFGIDRLIAERLAAEVGERREPLLSVELDTLLGGSSSEGRSA